MITGRMGGRGEATYHLADGKASEVRGVAAAAAAAVAARVRVRLEEEAEMHERGNI